MELKDLEPLLRLNPKLASRVQGVLDELRAGKLPDFVTLSDRREELLAGMRERVQALRAARDDSLRRHEVAIREQEETIAKLEQEIGAPRSPGRPDGRNPPEDELPTQPGRPNIPLRSGPRRRRLGG
jgi:hypothetical protein